jgi:preprotein translocase subunit SecD
MTRRNLLMLAIILALFALAVCVVVPLDRGLLGKKGMHLGLDLVGGVQLVYQAQFPEGATASEKARDMDRALTVIQSRIDKYGVTEPIIQQQEGERILVQLPGFTDIGEAKELVEQTGFLEFREAELSEGEPVLLEDYLDEARNTFFDEGRAGSRLFVGEEGTPVAFLVKDEAGNLSYIDERGGPIDVEELKQGSTELLSWIPSRGDDGTQLTGEFLAEAVAGIREQRVGSEAEVDIEWNEEGGEIFDQVAKRLYERGNYGTPERALGIFLDDVLISAPQILEPEYHGTGAITGNFSIQEADRLANLLESGALPMPLKKPPLYQQTVSATLGADFIDMSFRAGLVGIILIMVFMIVYYRLPGLLASLALIFYGTLVLALFKLWPGGGVTLTLAGIGGFVLSIGMAVDANVLIFERMKEELIVGRTLGAAIEAGFNRAWMAIRDSNITTFIVCGILYWLGANIVASAPVMGFALTLFIGVAVSMFTAIVVTRTLLRLFVGTPLARRTSLFNAYRGEDNV